MRVFGKGFYFLRKLNGNAKTWQCKDLAMQGLMKAAKSGSCIASPHAGYSTPFLCFVSVLEWLVGGGLVITEQRN